MSEPSPLETRLRAKASQLRQDAEALKRDAEVQISAMLMAAQAIEAELDAAAEALAPDAPAEAPARPERPRPATAPPA